MYGKFQQHLQAELAAIREAGLYKNERLITSPQQAEITVGHQKVLNFCANNYLGLSNHPRLIQAAKDAMDTRGYGMSSVRFICGTQDLHKQLEASIAGFFKTEDTILYAACFDANGGVFEPLRPKMPSSAMPSTTPPSSTACACARPSATAMPTPTWPTSKIN